MSAHNIHNPARYPDESVDGYRERRAASKAALLRATKPPMQTPATSPLDVSRFWLGHHTNPRRNAERKALRNARYA